MRKRKYYEIKMVIIGKELNHIIKSIENRLVVVIEKVCCG